MSSKIFVTLNSQSFIYKNHLQVPILHLSVSVKVATALVLQGCPVSNGARKKLQQKLWQTLLRLGAMPFHPMPLPSWLRSYR